MTPAIARRRPTSLLFLPALAGLGLTLLQGCAQPDPAKYLTTDMVGPMSGAPASPPTATATGALQVRTRQTWLNDGGIVYSRNTPYTIYRLDGQRVKGIVNHVGPDDSQAMVVPLPPGTYRVYAESDGYGIVNVPLLVVAAQITEVDLRYRGLVDAEVLTANDQVRLPDGRVIGRRAVGVPESPDVTKP